MDRLAAWRGRTDLAQALRGSADEGFRCAVPGLDVRWDAASASHAVERDALCVVWGSPRRSARADGEVAPAVSSQEVLATLRRRGTAGLAELRGSWGVFCVDARQGSAILAVDRFAAETACYAIEAETLHFSDRADAVPVRSRTVSPQSLYEYLYFHCIPAPATVFAEVQRLVNAHYLHFDGQSLRDDVHWTPRFDEAVTGHLSERSARFRDLVRGSVAVEAARGDRLGCFLSGGTDSSTVVGVLTAVTGSPVRTYSIGFDAAGYDEMEYARIAARRYESDHHEYYVTADDVLEGVPAVSAYFDQPFGNSSVVPAFFCARLARVDGVTRMLAGDGGDELFGGNSRYRLQLLLELYHRLPAALRARVIEPLATGAPGRLRVPGLRHALAYARHARVPLPDRLDAFNLVLRIGREEMLEGEFLRHVDPDAPRRARRRTYAATGARSALNRMLCYDWKYTLADADLPKVRGATGMAGVAVAYPLLADEIVDFSLGLPPSYKVRRLQLRWFFKQALRGVLPDAIIRKKKHGFGLPFGPWMTRHQGLRDLAMDSLDGLAKRSILRGGFRDDLVRTLLPAHPSYYGELVWILMMLEQWLARHETRGAESRAVRPAVEQ